MCAIGGFSLAPGSKINARGLTNALLTEGEARGTDASGYAYVMRDGKTTGDYRDAIRGSQLSLKNLPRDAAQVILHTRFATHGHQSNNANNHPVVSKTDRIRLVHNGVIWNHDDVRSLVDPDNELPDVDTSVIPAVLEQMGVEGLTLLAGNAAIAWFDSETDGIIHLARPDGSPVELAFTTDGSIIFASTERMLGNALSAQGIQWLGGWPDQFGTLNEKSYYQLLDGKMSKQPNVEWNDDYYGSAYGSRWDDDRKGFSTPSTGMSGTSYLRKNGYVQRSDGMWDYQPTSAGASPMKALEAARRGSEDAGDFDSDGNWWSEDESGAISMNAGIGEHDAFYVLDHDGDYEGYRSVYALCTMLAWYAEMSATDEDLVQEGDTKWVNHFSDVGTVSGDGSLNSWLLDAAESFDFDDQWPEGLRFIREGIDVLQRVMA